MKNTSKADFMKLYSLLSNPDRSISLKANKDILQLQNDINCDIWGISKELLDSLATTEMILGSQLLHSKVLKEYQNLQPETKHQIRHYILQCISRINTPAVKTKLAETFSYLSKQQMQSSNWSNYLNHLVLLMKAGEKNLVFGLMVLANLPTILSKQQLHKDKEKSIKQIVVSALSLNSSTVSIEALQTLLSWVKLGIDFLDDETLLFFVFQKCMTKELELCLNIIDAAVQVLYKRNGDHPLQKSSLQKEVVATIQKIFQFIPSLTQYLQDPNYSYIVSEFLLSVSIKIRWIYEIHFNEIFRLAFLILNHEDPKIRVLAVIYFQDIHFLKLPDDVLKSCWKKAIQIVCQKFRESYHQKQQRDDNDFSQYKYQCRHLLCLIMSKFIQSDFKTQIQHILKMCHSFVNSSDESINSLGMFFVLSIDESLKDIGSCPLKQQFVKDIIKFCCSSCNNLDLQVDCLKFLSLNCNEIISYGLQKQIVSSCISKLKNGSLKSKQYALNVLSLLLSCMENVDPKTEIIGFLIEFYRSKHILDDSLVQIFISAFIEFIQKIRGSYPMVALLLSSQLQQSLNYKSMRYLAFAMKWIQKSSDLYHLYSCFSNIKSYILSLLLKYQETYDHRSAINVFQRLIILNYPPLDQTEIDIVQAAIKLVSNDQKNNWYLLQYLFKSIELINLKQNQGACKIFEDWLKKYYCSINQLLVGIAQNIHEESYFILFFKIQEEILSYSKQLYFTFQNILSIFTLASNAIESTTNQFLVKAILLFYEAFLMVSQNSMEHLSIVRSTFRGLKHVNSSNHFSYFRILQTALKACQPVEIGKVIQQQFLNRIDFGVNTQVLELVTVLIIKMVSVNKHTYFKSLLIDLQNLWRKNLSFQQFSKCLESHKKKLKL